MNPRLRVEVGMQVDAEYEVPPEKEQAAVWLGRGALCDIEINDPQLSRRHCRFVFDGERFFVEDMKSRNGTKVNSESILGPVELHHSDEVTVGGNVLKVVWPSASRREKVDFAKLGTKEELAAAFRRIADLQDTEFAGYRMERIICERALSVIFLARDPERGIPVAVKIQKQLAKIDDRDRARFITGAKLAGSLKHHGFARIIKGGQAKGFLFIASEFAAGRNVEKMVEDKRGPLDLRLSITIAKQILDALDSAHEIKLVHGGVFGDNVLVGDRLTVKLVDYDMTRPVTKPEQTADVSSMDILIHNCHMDRSFAAPEQIAYPAVADPKSDVFGAGAVLYYMLCGRAPFDQSLPGPRLSSAFDRAFDPPRALNPAVPDAVSSVVMQAMSEYSRFNTAREMKAALEDAARIGRV